MIKKKGFQKMKKKIWPAMICPVLFIILMRILIPFIYGMVDDRSMMEIVSGQYTGMPDPHMIFTGYWYGLLVAGFYWLLPQVDWYALCMLALEAACLGLMLYRLMGKRQKRNWWTALFFLLICVCMGIRPVTQVTFTTTGAVLAVALIFWYMTMEEIHMYDLIVLGALGLFAVELRFSVYVMVLPVCGVLWLFRVWKEKGRDKKNLLIPVIAAGVLGIYGMGILVGYGNKGWTSYRVYNDNRSLIYDYEDYMFPRFEDAQVLYGQVGVESKARAKNLYYYNYTADDQVNQEFFADYLQAKEEQLKSEQISILTKLKQTLKTYVKSAVSGKYGYVHLVLLGGYLALIILLLLKREYEMTAKCDGSVCRTDITVALSGMEGANPGTGADQYESDAGGAAGSILDRGTQACANAGKSGKNGNGTVSGDSVYLCRSADKDREGGKCGTGTMEQKCGRSERILHGSSGKLLFQ